MSNLFDAAQDGATDAIQFLLDYGDDINAQNINGDSALMIAIMNERYHVASYLIERGADVNLFNNYQQSALTLAGKHALIIKKIIDAGYDQHNKIGSPALHQIAKTRNINLIKYVIEKGWNINVANKNGETILFDALKNVGFLEQLLKADLGLNINFVANQTPDLKKKDRSPLSEASLLKTTKAARLLMNHGADINASYENDQLRTPLMQVNATDAFVDMIFEEFFDKINLRRENTKGFGLAHYMAFRCHMPAMEKLVAAEVDVIKSASDQALTPLMVISRHDDEKHRLMIAYLIHHGANIGQRGANGKTAIDIAIENKHEDLAFWMAEYHAQHKRQRILELVDGLISCDSNESSGLRF